MAEKLITVSEESVDLFLDYANRADTKYSLPPTSCILFENRSELCPNIKDEIKLCGNCEHARSDQQLIHKKAGKLGFTTVASPQVHSGDETVMYSQLQNGPKDIGIAHSNTAIKIVFRSRSEILNYLQKGKK